MECIKPLYLKEKNTNVDHMNMLNTDLWNMNNVIKLLFV